MTKIFDQISKSPVESVADFKLRIAIKMREIETGKKWSVIGASRANDCVKRNKRGLK